MWNLCLRNYFVIFVMKFSPFWTIRVSSRCITVWNPENKTLLTKTFVVVNFHVFFYINDCKLQSLEEKKHVMYFYCKFYFHKLVVTKLNIFYKKDFLLIFSFSHCHLTMFTDKHFMLVIKNRNNYILLKQNKFFSPFEKFWICCDIEFKPGKKSNKNLRFK